MPSTPSIAHAFQRSARVSRSDLYGTAANTQMPLNLRDDAIVPFLGFCGSNYQKGGCVLLAINPGGGGDAYTLRTPQDERLIPLIHKFVSSDDSSVVSSFDAMSENYSGLVQTWNLWRIFRPTIEACGYAIDQVCYLNCFPYRTAKDAKPAAQALGHSWQKIVVPLLNELNPSMLVALGKKAGSVVERFHKGPTRLYVVPRTIGDTVVSAEALKVHAELRSRAT